MTERSRQTQITDYNPDEIGTLFPELVEAIDEVETEFVRSMNDVLVAEIEQEHQQLGVERAQRESLQDKYKLPFNPDKTIPRVGGVAIALVSPDIANDMIKRESVSVVDGLKEKEQMEQDELDKEFDDAVAEKRAQAKGVIESFLRNGADPSVLTNAGLPAEWVKALTARGRTRLEEHDSVEDIPADEIYGMINVCAIGLVKAERGIDFGDH